MFSLISKFNLLPSLYRYLSLGVIIFALSICSYCYTLNKGYKKGLKEAQTECQVEQKDQQIQSQNETIQVIQKAKVISKSNSFLERDQLIDKL